MVTALAELDMVALAVPHEHLPAGAVGVLLDLYPQHGAAQCEIRHPADIDWRGSLDDLVTVALDQLRRPTSDEMAEFNRQQEARIAAFHLWEAEQ